MTGDDLDRIERELGVRLPDDYRGTMLAYPFAADPHAAGLWLVNEAAWVIETTSYHRHHGCFDLPWPASQLVLGGDGTGNHCALDLGRSPAAILFADHEVPHITELAPDWAAWPAMLRGWEAELEEERRRRRW